MWIVKPPHALTREDMRENVTRLQRSRECDNSSAPMATVYVQILVAVGRESVRLLGGNLSLHTDELQRAGHLPQMIYEALTKEE